VIHDLVSVPVEAVRQEAFRDRHADRIRRPLAQRPGRGLHAGSQAVLGVAGSAASPLAEGLDVVERQVVTREMKEAVEQHRAVAGRENEAVAIGPMRIVRIVLQESLPQDVCHRGGAERQPGMARVSFLHRVDRQRADGVDAERVEGVSAGGQGASFEGSILLRGPVKMPRRNGNPSSI
jgi:hypothetical protein